MAMRLQYGQNPGVQEYTHTALLYDIDNQSFCGTTVPFPSASSSDGDCHPLLPAAELYLTVASTCRDLIQPLEEVCSLVPVTAYSKICITTRKSVGVTRLHS